MLQNTFLVQNLSKIRLGKIMVWTLKLASRDTQTFESNVRRSNIFSGGSRVRFWGMQTFGGLGGMEYPPGYRGVRGPTPANF